MTDETYDVVIEGVEVPVDPISAIVEEAKETAREWITTEAAAMVADRRNTLSLGGYMDIHRKMSNFQALYVFFTTHPDFVVLSEDVMSDNVFHVYYRSALEARNAKYLELGLPNRVVKTNY